MKQNEDGFSLIDLLASITIISIIVMLVVPQLIMAFDRGRQRRSVADLRNLSTALSTYHLDHSGAYPTSGAGLAALQPDYYAGIPVDGWNNGYYYIGVAGGSAGGACGYILLGLGLDGAIGPAAPDPWVGDEFDPDISLVNGTFHAAPGRPNESAEIPTTLASSCT